MKSISLALTALLVAQPVVGATLTAQIAATPPAADCTCNTCGSKSSKRVKPPSPATLQRWAEWDLKFPRLAAEREKRLAQERKQKKAVVCKCKPKLDVPVLLPPPPVVPPYLPVVPVVAPPLSTTPDAVCPFDSGGGGNPGGGDGSLSYLALLGLLGLFAIGGSGGSVQAAQSSVAGVILPNTVDAVEIPEPSLTLPLLISAFCFGLLVVASKKEDQ